MIQNYKNLQVKKLYDGENIRAWSGIRRQAEKRLRIMDAADRLEVMMVLPSNRLEALCGDRKNQYSIRINNRSRICFTWPSGLPGPGDVEIVDYQ